MSSSWMFIKTIAKKEVVEFIRDWRTLLALVIIPLLIFPALFIALPLLLQSEAAELDALELDVNWQGDFSEELGIAFNDSNIRITFEDMPQNIDNLSDIGDDLDKIRNQETKAIFRLLENESGWKFSIIYLSTSEASNEARTRMITAISTWESNVVNGTLVEAGLVPEDTWAPVKWDGDYQNADAATKGEQAGLALSLFIPMVIAI